MKPILSSRYHRDDIPISSSMDCAQEVFWYLYQLPVVQDMTYLAPVIHRPPPVYQYYSQGDSVHLDCTKSVYFGHQGNDNYIAMDVSY